MIICGSWTFEDNEDALAFFEEKLFEIKQHLQSKPLLQATVKPRVTLLNQLVPLEEILEINAETRSLSFPDYSGISAEDQWIKFSKALSAWKLAVFKSSSAREILNLITAGFELLQPFYALIPVLAIDEEDPKIGVAENSMVLQNGFTWMKDKGLNHFSELESYVLTVNEENQTAKLFFLELKRLSLRLPYL